MSLTAFLLERIAEDAAIAVLAATSGGDWFDGLAEWSVEPKGESPRWVIGARAPWRSRVGSVNKHPATHIVHWDPARVLAECAAKRRIIELHTQMTDFDEHRCIRFDTWGGVETALGDECGVLAILAAPYATHPDFDVSWSPPQEQI